jgi:hypothetical protein
VRQLQQEENLLPDITIFRIGSANQHKPDLR